MPELPEVETMRRGLEKHLLGKTIESVEIRLARIFTGDELSVIGATISKVRRYGKGLVIDLSNSYSLTAHVKMTGQFVYVGGVEQNNFHPNLGITGALPNKWTHVIFRLLAEDGEQSTLFYNDIRQFGWIKVVKTGEVAQQPFFKNLGPEPFSDLTLPLFEKIVGSSSMPIKPLLMDQAKLSGVGNIYANDALYGARINPSRTAKSLSQQEVKNLYKELLQVLQKGIDHGGASEINYINVEGAKGSYQDHFLVYGKKGELCSRDGEVIVRIVQAGRSTFFCPACQS